MLPSAQLIVNLGRKLMSSLVPVKKTHRPSMIPRASAGGAAAFGAVLMTDKLPVRSRMVKNSSVWIE
jgi:hypothetical protein